MELNEHFSVLDNIDPHQDIYINISTLMHPEETKAHPTALHRGVLGGQDFKPELRSDSAEKEQLGSC